MGKLSDALEKSMGEAVSGKGSKEKEEISTHLGGTEASPQSLYAKESSSVSTDRWDRRILLANTVQNPAGENFRRLRTEIIHPSIKAKYKTILVTSIASSEGKGFVSANLGISIAQSMQYSALLVDCDLRKPGLAVMFGLSDETGLVDYLKDNIALSQLIREAGIPKLSLIPAGKPPANPADLLDSEKMKQAIKELANQYDDRIVIFDSPPHIVAPEVAILAQLVDGIILVVRSGYSKKEHVKEFVKNVGKNRIIGIVFNGYEPSPAEQLFQSKKGYGSYYDAYG